MMKNRIVALLVCGFFVYVSGCATGPTLQDTEHKEISSSEEVYQLLDQSQSLSGTAAYALQLRAAELLVADNRPQLARPLLDVIPADKLSGELLGRYSVLRSTLAISTGDTEKALLLLNSPQLLQQADEYPIALQISISDLRARALSLQGSHLASIQERIFIAPLLQNAQLAEDNQRAIWQSLMFVPLEQLKASRDTAIADDYRGWLELAIIAKNEIADLDEQLKQLDTWLAHWPNHPGAIKLPSDLALLQEIAANRPQHIAVLLPLSGKFAPVAKSVLEGFLAAYYLANPQARPQLQIYDTAAGANVQIIYQQAIHDGAEMVVGPLLKDNVRLLFDMVELPVPTLALNYVEDYGDAPAQLYQFGLATEDEVKQIALLAYLENHHNAMILAPESAWGEKATQELSQQWLSLGGHIVSSRFYQGTASHSPVVKEILQIDQSDSRAREMRRMIGRRIEFEPRRRNDVDAVFLLARPQQARSIKPMLAFHYAGDLPVYSTSQIYSGTPTQDLDSDLNNIKFNDMPWTLQPPMIRTRFIEKEADYRPDYTRMYALGVDAFRLYPRLQQLDQVKESRMYGESGTLSLNDKRHIERELLWAKFKNGLATPMPIIASYQALKEQRDAEKTGSPNEGIFQHD